VIDTSLFTVPAERIDAPLLMAFLAQQVTERLFTESTTLEFKRQSSSDNVVRAICAMANTSGGIVLVGVDERTPRQVPGVEPDEHGKLVDRCRLALEPTFVPEIIPVPLDAERVVLVVRVQPQLADRPVFCGGAVWVRVPGQTVRASRPQVMDMIARQAAYGTVPAGMASAALASTFYPPTPNGTTDDAALPELRLRAAAGVLLRPEAHAHMMIGSALKDRLRDAIDGSNAVRWAAGRNPPAAESWWEPEIVRATEWRQRRLLNRRWGPDNVSVAVHVRLEAARLAWSVDVDVAGSEPQDAATAMGADLVVPVEHWLRGWTELAALVGTVLPDAVSEEILSPPLTHAGIVLWAVSGRADLRRAVGLDRLSYDLDRGNRTADWRMDLDGPDDVPAALSAWLQRLLLDEGVSDGDRVAVSFVEQALSAQPGAAGL
jgi:hypothetical protein